MTVSPFTNSASLSTQECVAIDYELVRGNEDRVHAELLPRVRQGNVALDLSQVERIDAAGIAALITLYCSAIEAGNEFYVVDPSIRVLEMLRLVGLESILVAEEPLAQEEFDAELAISAPLRFSRSAA